MNYVIKIKLADTTVYFAADQRPSPHAEYDGTTVRIADTLSAARVYKSRGAAQADIDELRLGGEVVEVGS